MPVRELFLPLLNYPEPTPASAIETVIDLAESLEKQCRPKHSCTTEVMVHTRISALVLETEIEPGLYFEGAHIGEFLKSESERSAKNAKELSDTFGKLTKNRAVLTSCKVLKQSPCEGLDFLVEEARLHHITVLPMARDNAHQQDIAERLIFESGRPILIFPQSSALPMAKSFENIAVAWDGSRPAARAVADAMPFLRRASQVRIFSATDEKATESASRGIAIADQLNAEGVFTIFEEVKKDNTDIGNFMERYVVDHKSDLLIMGAFGHSRFREFILGGATKSTLVNPPCWVLLAH